MLAKLFAALPAVKREFQRILHPAAGAEKNLLLRTSWFFVNGLVLTNRLQPFSWARVAALRAFGARVGDDVVIRPGTRVKFPWKLEVAHRVSIGEDVWIDNIDSVTLGQACVLSQGVYLCTGNHDWRHKDMPLTARPIKVEPHAWVGAKTVIAPGVTVGRNALVRLGSIVTKDVPPLSDAERGL